MPLLVVCFVLVVALPVAVGVLAHRRDRSVFGGPQAWGAAAAARFGPLPGAALVLVAGLATTVGVGLGLGFLAKGIESSVDEPTFRWVHARVADNVFTRGQEKLTMMGNNPIIQLVFLVAGIVLACAFRRRWWLPVIALGVAYVGEKYAQKVLAKIVDRGHPPTTLGTYPSGGVGRILADYGTIIVLVLLLHTGLSRAWRAGLWTGLVTAACVESFSRLYLSKHWLTDALFGLPFGVLLLLTNVATVAALAQLSRGVRRGPTDAAGPHAKAPGPRTRQTVGR